MVLLKLWFLMRWIQILLLLHILDFILLPFFWQLNFFFVLNYFNTVIDFCKHVVCYYKMYLDTPYIFGFKGFLQFELFIIFHECLFKKPISRIVCVWSHNWFSYAFRQIFCYHMVMKRILKLLQLTFPEVANAFSCRQHQGELSIVFFQLTLFV